MRGRGNTLVKTVHDPNFRESSVARQSRARERVSRDLKSGSRSSSKRKRSVSNAKSDKTETLPKAKLHIRQTETGDVEVIHDSEKSGANTDVNSDQ